MASIIKVSIHVSLSTARVLYLRWYIIHHWFKSRHLSGYKSSSLSPGLKSKSHSLAIWLTEWQELFSIVVACAIWYPYFSGERIQFWCDNESVVSIINSGHSNAPRIMDLLRFLVLISMKHNFFVRARHVPGSPMRLLMPSHAFRSHVSGQQLPRPRESPAPSRLCS